MERPDWTVGDFSQTTTTDAVLEVLESDSEGEEVEEGLLWADYSRFSVYFYFMRIPSLS